jgi:hypothetical protein
MKPIFDMKCVDDTAAFIATELRTLLDRKNIDSHMSRRMRECPAYNKGQTIGEAVLATLLALNPVQNEVARDLGLLETEASDWDEDEDEAA